MKARVLLNIPKAVHQAVWRHLLPRRFVFEEAAFIYAQRRTEDDSEIFQYLDWSAVPPIGFVSRSRYHFELTDETRASVIKRAHDLNASLVELHSHSGIWPAQFSPSDLLGFQEFVPHVWWRLKRRPYLALVISSSSFDGFVWTTNPNTPRRLDGIVVEKLAFTPTKLSPLRYNFHDDNKI